MLEVGRKCFGTWANVWILVLRRCAVALFVRRGVSVVRIVASVRPSAVRCSTVGCTGVGA